MSATYAGVILSSPSPELALEIEAKISLRDLPIWQSIATPGMSRERWAWAGINSPRPIRVGTLWWPRDASRFAVGYFLATDNQVAAIRQQVYAGNSYKAAPLVLTQEDQNGPVESITTNLWMLPAWPRIQITGSNGVRLLILVDDRYWWSYKTTGQLTITEGTTTWTDLYATLGTALGVTINVDPVNSAYLKPSIAFTTSYESAPCVLDEVARSVGQRIVRNLDGTVYARSVTTSQAIAQQNAATATKRAGGKLDLNPTQPNDLPGVLPEAVVVVFQQVSGGALIDPYPVTKTLAGLLLSDFPSNVVTNPNTKTISNSATYDGTNAVELDAMAAQIATDFYRYAVAKYDVKIPGIFPWVPEGWDDTIEWAYRTWEVSTRVLRPPLNDLHESMGSHSSAPEPTVTVTIATNVCGVTT